MTSGSPAADGGFLDDPDGLILEVVIAVEPDLDPAAVTKAVTEAAPSRAQRRRLANALADDPELLVSGRATGPPQVERLIRSLHAIGATHLVLTRCGHCGQARPLHGRDGAVRICTTCRRRRDGKAKPCANCGSTRQVAGRDREGRPLCPRCRHYRNYDPITELGAAICRVDPAQDRATLEDLVRTAVPRQFQRHQVLWELERRPDLLTGAGAHGSQRVNILIRALAHAGVPGVVVPACPSCGRTVALNFQHNGQRCCRRCYDTVRALPCVRCGNRKRVAARTADGEPVCPPCFNDDPANHEPCAGCGRVTRVYRRGNGRLLCQACFRAPLAICSICGQHKPCFFADTDQPRCEHCSRLLRLTPCGRCGRTRPVWARTDDGQPLCNSCFARPEPCTGCEQNRKVKGRTTDGQPLCGTCYPKDPISFRPCTQCGSTERLHHHGLCPHCASHQQLLALLSNPAGDVHPHLEPVFRLLAATEPKAVLNWLERSSARTVLAEAGQHARPLTHEALDRHLPDRAIDHLRTVLVTAGALPPRDEHVVRFERWITEVGGQVADPGERRIVRSFAVWHALRRLRARAERRDLTSAQVDNARSQIRAAIALITWLRRNDITLATCSQRDIDRWLTEEPSTTRHARAFLIWTCRNGHTHDVEIPLPPRDDGASRIEDDHRWALLRRLLHDDELPLEDRVGGLLVLFYGQPLSKLTRITRDQITHDDNGRAQLLLGTTPLALPSPLDRLMQQLAATRRGHAVVGRATDLPWLFPGARPGQPLGAASMMHRLQRLGIQARAGRNTTLSDLATKLPAVVLSKLLGVSISTAARWSERAGASRADYAAEVSRREAFNKF